MRPVSLKDVYLTLIVAFLLYLLPWAGFGLLLRPDFVLLVLLYWMLRAPHLCNVGTAWMMGLLIDVASGSFFGQYALAYSITAFFAILVTVLSLIQGRLDAKKDQRRHDLDRFNS